MYLKHYSIEEFMWQFYTADSRFQLVCEFCVVSHHAKVGRVHVCNRCQVKADGVTACRLCSSRLCSGFHNRRSWLAVATSAPAALFGNLLIICPYVRCSWLPFALSLQGIDRTVALLFCFLFWFLFNISATSSVQGPTLLPVLQPPGTS